MLANVANGGLAPILKGKEIEEIGIAFTIYPSLTSLVAAAAMENALVRLLYEKDVNPADIPMMGFNDFCSMIGFEDVWAFEKEWSK